jgi:hypothetical protein
VRERLVSQRTGIINQIRAFLLERGVAVRQGFTAKRGFSNALQLDQWENCLRSTKMTHARLSRVKTMP